MADTATERLGPLAGVKVLDMARFISGPLCAMVLGDWGADVIKVERPTGEDARHYPLQYAGDSLYSLTYNRNKRGIGLDLRNPEALPILERLVAWSDVVVENFRPGTLDRMGLGLQRLRAINEGVIVVSISGFGQTGPWRDRPLFDAIAQAMSGMMSLTGEADGRPTMTGTYTADHTTALWACVGALLALYHRSETGVGQNVDVGMLDGMFATLGVAATAYLNTGLVMTRTGNRDALTTPGNTFPTRDGHVYIDAGSDAMFKRLCEAMRRPDLSKAERFRSNDDRRANVESLESEIADWTGEHKSEEVCATLARVGVPAGSVSDVQEVADAPQTLARDMVIERDLRGARLRLAGIPVKLSVTPGSVRRSPPAIGEDSRAILREICRLPDGEIDLLEANHVISAAGQLGERWK